MVILPPLPGGHRMSALLILSNKIPSLLVNAVLDGATVMPDRLSQKRNAKFPIVATPEGIKIPVSPSHPSKEEAPMLRTLDGIVTPVRWIQPENAEAAMPVTFDGIVTLPALPPGHWRSVPKVLSNRIPPALLYFVFCASTTISVKRPHP